MMTTETSTVVIELVVYGRMEFSLSCEALLCRLGSINRPKITRRPIDMCAFQTFEVASQCLPAILVKKETKSWPGADVRAQ